LSGEKILNENKKNTHPWKLNGRSLTHCHLAAVNIWAHVDWYEAAIGNWRNQILVTESTLNVGCSCWTQFWKGRAPFHSTLMVKFGSVLEGKIKIWKIMMYYEQTTDTKSWHTLTWPLSRWAKMTHTQIDYCSNEIMRHTNGSIKQFYVLAKPTVLTKLILL
jgi:hypothetical protein